MRTWEAVIVVAACGALIARVMSLGSWFPPPRHWRPRAQVGVWVFFLAATALVSLIALAAWGAKGSSAA